MNPPHFWKHGLDPQSREAAPVVRSLLTPLAHIYAWAGARRIKSTEPHKCGVPVICVGNVTVGGTGKTPVVAAIRKMAEARGIRAATLSRGYKGRLSGPLKVDAMSHTAEDVGDEPLMLAMQGESWIGANRAETGKAMAADGVELIIMDDGFQNPGLFKDHSILVIDSDAPFGNGYVIPKGPLREPVSIALARADSVLLMGAGPIPEEIRGTKKIIHRAKIEPDAAPPSGPIIVFAGIGRPQKVFDAIEVHGANISESVPYPDHHTYTPGDMRYLRALSKERGANLVTTTKDYARLPASERSGIVAWPVSAVFENEEKILELISTVIETPSA